MDDASGGKSWRPWAVRIAAIGLLSWVLHAHGGLELLRSVAERLGGRWPLLLLPWAAGLGISLLAYRVCLPGRGSDVPTSVLVRVQLAGAALNRVLPLGASSSNIMKVALLRHWYSAEALVAAGIWGSLATGVGNALGGLGPILVLALGYSASWSVVSLAVVSIAMGVPAITALAFASKGLSARLTRLLAGLPITALRSRRSGIVDWASRLDAHVAAATGERRGDFRRVLALRLAAQIVRVLEIGLAAHLLGLAGGLPLALLYNSMSRSVTQIIRFIPGRLGVMEVTAGAMFVSLGLEAGDGLALALALRVRYLAGLLLSFSVLSTVHDLPALYPPRSEEERTMARQKP